MATPRTTESIGEIASIKTMLDEAKNFQAFKRALPLLSPFLRLMGADVKKLKETLAAMDEVRQQMDEHVHKLDRFNELFAERGWISYERLDSEVSSAAVAKAEEGDWEGAESVLVNHFTPEQVRFGLMTMNAVEAFRPRMQLAEKALEDYAAARYHACVPVVLALLDGMINEVHQKARGVRRGISAEGVDLGAWDSIAAHNSGLNQLVKVFQTGRRRTTVDPITLPYRNGIMHGIDLGYDNKIVAAKVWAALFAAREWAVRAERGQHEAPPPKPELTLRETLTGLVESARRYKAVQDAAARDAEWQPRSVRVGVEIPRNGEPEEYGEDTPERKLAEYFAYWGKRNYGHMARCIGDLWGPPRNKAAAAVREEFRDKKLVSYQFLELKQQAHSLVVLTVGIQFEVNGSIADLKHEFRMVYEGEDGMPALPGLGPAEWKVITWRVPLPASVWEEESDREELGGTA
jgi:hypothetical protein